MKYNNLVCIHNHFPLLFHIDTYYHYIIFQVHSDHTFEKEYTGLGAAFGLVQTLVAPGMSSLMLSRNNSAEYDGLAGIIGDRQHTL